MAKRGYKLQEFVAHASDVNCLYIGKKSCRVFLTGGEDRKVNLWAIGKPTSLLSLSGHTSSVQSLTFDSAEVLVLAGSSSGTIKLWDLEEAKIVRTLTGHRSNCTSVEFHPFGEFFASGSLDTDLKIWDIRKKGCIHTYKGHTRGIRTIKFTPDGRWVVTGGDDNVVKIWDLTAGKLLHDFKFHGGTIRCIDFHPQEFLLATGSADRTVKFWDLETFELIGSAGPESTGVRAMIFHPDGRSLFCGLDETLKVFSWEPIRCHDVVDLGWSTLGDLGIYEGKLLGCSYHQYRVGVWVADISLIGPYAVGVMSKKNGLMEPLYGHGKDHPVELKGTSANSSMMLSAEPSDCGVKTKVTIRTPGNISDECSESVLQGIDPSYSSNMSPVNSAELKRDRATLTCHTAPQKFSSKFSSKVSTLNSSAFRASKTSEVSPGTSNRTESSFASKEMPPRRFSSNKLLGLKDGLILELDAVNNSPANGRAVSMPIVVPRDSLDQEPAASSRKYTAATDAVAPGATFGKLNNLQQPSYAGGVSNGQLVTTRPRSPSGMTDDLRDTDSNFLRQSFKCEAVAADGANFMHIGNVAEKFERSVSLEQPVELSNDKNSETTCSSSETSSVKYVRGVAVQLGRTRSLVERFERRETCNSSSMATVSSSSEQAAGADNLPSLPKGQVHTSERDVTVATDDFFCNSLLQNHDVFVNAVKSRLIKLQVVLHFWEHNGIKGAIDAAAKLPDYSVQVDVISVLKEKIDLFTLDKFSCLLPVLDGLLNSKTERHVTISLEMLLELVKIFGPVIHSTISASSLVGIDLQAEQRLERCNQCYNHLEKIKKTLPLLIRRGGLVAKHAQEVNIALQDSQ